MIYEYTSVQVIFGLGIIGVGFNSGQIESSRNRIGFKMGIVRVGFGLSIFESLRFGFELGRVISGVGDFGSHYNSGFARLRIGLLRVFGSKSVHPISDVGSGMDLDRSVRLSGLGSVLLGLGGNTQPSEYKIESDGGVWRSKMIPLTI